MAITLSQGGVANLQATPRDAAGATTTVKAGSASWSSSATTKVTVVEDGANQLLAAATAVMPGDSTISFAARDSFDVRDVAGLLGVTVRDADHFTHDLANPVAINPGATATPTLTARDSVGVEVRPVGVYFNSALGAQHNAVTWSAAGGTAVITHAETGEVPTPAAPTVTPQGAPGGEDYSYAIVALNAARQPTNASPTGQTNNGAFPLSGINFNRVTWAAVAGAVTYQVWLITSGSAPLGLKGETAATTFDDTSSVLSGILASLYDIPPRTIAQGLGTAPTVTPQGTTGATAYTYKIVSRNVTTGRRSVASSGGSTATGNATLDGTNFNRVTWAGAFPDTAPSLVYEVWRTASAGSGDCGTIGYVGETGSATFDDIGAAASPTGQPQSTNDTARFPKRLITGVAGGNDVLTVTATSPGGVVITGTVNIRVSGAVSADITQV